MNTSELLEKLENNLNSIAAERNTLKEKCTQLESELEELKDKLTSAESEKNISLDYLNNQSNSFTPPETNKGVKLKIEGLIEEIDECLTLLNN